MPEALDPKAIQSCLRTRVLGKRVLCFQQMDSTNAYLMDLASKGEPEGTVVMADEQIAGRGRLGRTWRAPQGTSLLVSVLLRPKVGLADSCKLSLIAALAVRRMLQEVVALSSLIKWPNDVLVNGRKVCGILAETTTGTGPGSVPALVLGIGLNVNQERDDFPEELRDQATSLRIEAGRKKSRLPLLLRLLSSLEDLYLAFEQNGFPPLLDELRQSSAVMGKRVKVQLGTYTLEGIIEDLDDEGRLLMRQDAGSTTILTSGEVSSIRPL